MQRSTILLPLLALFCAASLQASPFSYLKAEGFYISSTANISVPHDSDATFNGINGDIELNNGFGITAAVGHHFMDSWRMELEYAFRSNDVDKYTAFAGNTFGSGTITAHTLMINFLYDININYHFFWYGGAGVGFARTKLDLNGKQDTDLVFANQLLTGFGYRLSKQTSFLVGYRLFHTLKQDYEINGNSVTNKGPWQHIFEIGLRYDF